RGGTATPPELLDVKDSLVTLRNLLRLFERLQNEYPHLFEIFNNITIPSGIIEAISRSISDHGEILDDASPALAAIRQELKVVRERLQSKLQRYLSDPETAPILQEPIITQREGRYVLPIRADFKGRIKAIVHDQSASGATLFIEPLPIVELNNQNRQLQLDERDEEQRILSSLTSMLANHLNELEAGLSALAKFDFVLACSKYALKLNATQPILVSFKPTKSTENLHPGSIIRLIQARHPLLDANTVVPIDVELEDQTFAMVITGPNTGGKTVSLKTIGLLTLMAQCGLHIPAASGSTLSVFQSVFADIGDEQSIEQSLSTFSGHIKNIVRILQQADWRSLVILDELGAGTDPQEGAALARAILTYLVEHRITTIVTTHHPELKIFAHVTPWVTNASVEFDLDTLQPTYHLTVGLPGRSNAIAIAQRLGMPSEIIQKARAEVTPQELQSQDLLDEIYRQRD
ncbi:MAG: endonuclease MutS2, partial [Anaerolineales bacterium]